jgi:BMFP domain-containing protein YqiC
MAKAQVEAIVRRLELARAEDLEAALEVARRARTQAEALEARVAALEAEVAALKSAAPAAG